MKVTVTAWPNGRLQKVIESGKNLLVVDELPWHRESLTSYLKRRRAERETEE